MSTSFQWFPFLPTVYYAALAALGLLVVALALYRRMPDAAWRGLLGFLLLFLFLNPVMTQEERTGLPDKLVIVVDETPSQKIGDRHLIAEKALQHVLQRASALKDVEPVIMRVGNDARSVKGEGTYLFSHLRDNLMSVPLSQVAGTVFITDGQIHDVPPELGVLERLAPFHAVLTGKKDEFDRKVTIVSAPKYGVLDEDIRISLRVEEFGRTDRNMLPLTIKQDNAVVDTAMVLPGELREFTFKVKHPGQNIFEFSIPVEDGELTAGNNNAPVIVNGIRDRLRVLLVSDAPHMGERAWRNLLKSDPAIDLVHFTILRPPSAIDNTPQREMSLIAFPVDELFERRIRDFDLIIFDRYQQYGLLLQHYFTNIASFINNGGAFLLAMGTEARGIEIFGSAIGKLMPVAPLSVTGDEMVKKTFEPALTETGNVHPVTADLLKSRDAKGWGKWFSAVPVSQTRGQALMSGPDGNPLLVIDKVGEGRVAVLSSDNIWLWAKGQQTGGPYTELLRNLSHWLMKEPELEEDFIKAEAEGYVITVSQRNIGPMPKVAEMTAPDGTQKKIEINTPDAGWLTAQVTVEQNGIYRFSNGTREAFVVVGATQNVEFTDVHTTADRVAPIVAATKGRVIWFGETPDFALRQVDTDSTRTGGDGWIGLRQNKAYTVDSVTSAALLPNWLFLLILLTGVVGVWWRESGKK